jgi:peptidoglycan/xylan/chitin deacetylase (PgdA/CDA1 family)
MPGRFHKQVGVAQSMGAARREIVAGSQAVRFSGAEDSAVDPVARMARYAAAAVALVLIGVLHEIPRVDGHRVRPGTTVAQALSERGTYEKYCGDEVDVAGVVLRRCGGLPPAVTVRKRTMGVDHAMGWGERAKIGRGSDVREPAQEFLTQSDDPDDGVTTTTTRYVLGSISGKQADREQVTVAPAKVTRIALTFDDGPHTNQTPQYLKLLAAYHAHATFFVLGDCAIGLSGLIKREIAEGHEIGIHSWSHRSYAGLSTEQIRSDLNRCQALLNRMGVPRVRWMRPPYGAINARVRAAIVSRGYHVALWDVDTNDWQKPPAGTIASRIMRGIGDGNVILMHDGGGDRSRTIAALGMALPKLHERGVRMLTMSQLKGLEPAPPTSLVVAEEAGKTKLTVVRVKVTVDGRAIDPPPTTAKSEGQVLVAAGAVLRAAGVECTWDNKFQTLNAKTPAGEIVLRANSRRFTLGGVDALATASAIEYEGELLAPIGLVVRLLDAKYVMEKDGSITITTTKAK